jgi:hypothetical protein
MSVIYIHLIYDKIEFWVDPVAQMVAVLLTVILIPGHLHIAISLSAISFDSVWYKNTCKISGFGGTQNDISSL